MQQNILPLGCSVSAKTNANGLSDDSCLIRLLYKTRMLYFFPWNLGWKAEGRKRINVAYSLKAMLQPWLSRKVKRHRFSTASLHATHPCNKLTGLACQLHHPLRQLKRSAASLFRGNLRLHHEALYIISQHCRGLSPYGTFTNITTDQTSGVVRQIWHTYLNEQQGSLGSLGLYAEPGRRAEAQLHYSAKTLSASIIHFISARARSSFAQGQQKVKRRFSFFSPRNKCTWQVGILSFGFAEHDTPASSTEHVCACEPSHPRADCGWKAHGQFL